MRKKSVLIIAGIILLAALLVCFGWWHSPKTFLKDVAPTDVVRIEVFNGNTGACFFIEDAADIAYIVRKIGDVRMRKAEYAHVDGFTYSLSFMGADGEQIAQFILNGSDTIRDGAIRYEAILETDEDALCFAYIKSLEEAQRNHSMQ